MRDGVRKLGRVRCICGPEAQVDQMRARLGAPDDCVEERVDVRRELAIKHAYREQLGAGALLANRRGDGGSMTDAIDEVISRLDERMTARDVPDVRVTGVNAAVEHRHLHATSGHSGERWLIEREPHAGLVGHLSCAAEQTGERRVVAAEQQIGRPFFDDTTAFENDHPVGATRELETVGDDDGRMVFHHGFVA